ncbi:MAG TPA: hypothetical protein DHW02_04145 [Ktedonobacter sp.]|nr:hypothetical protein [Ktedonobacter sp.]
MKQDKGGIMIEGTTERNRVLIQWALLLLSLVGTGIALYLTAVHYENIPLFCSASGLVNCERVTSSPYSVLFGTTIPITVPGLGWSIVSAVLAIVGLRTASSPSGIFSRVVLAQFVWSLLGLLTVIYLVYVEIVLLHTICAWCTGLHVTILAMFLLTLVLLLSGSTGPGEQGEEEEDVSISSTPRLH